MPGLGEGLGPPFSSREARGGGLALLCPGAASFTGVWQGKLTGLPGVLGLE